MLDKKYIYLQDEGDKYWIELDGENYAVRQISVDVWGRYHLSCFEDCLAEGVFEEKCIEKIISKNEFAWRLKRILQYDARKGRDHHGNLH